MSLCSCGGMYKLQPASDSMTGGRWREIDACAVSEYTYYERQQQALRATPSSVLGIMKRMIQQMLWQVKSVDDSGARCLRAVRPWKAKSLGKFQFFVAQQCWKNRVPCMAQCSLLADASDTALVTVRAVTGQENTWNIGEG